MEVTIKLKSKDEDSLIEQLKIVIYCIEGGIENAIINDVIDGEKQLISIKTDYNDVIVDEIKQHMYETDEVAFELKEEECLRCGSELCASVREDTNTWDVECNHVDCDWQPVKNVYIGLNELVKDYKINKID